MLSTNLSWPNVYHYFYIVTFLSLSISITSKIWRRVSYDSFDTPVIKYFNLFQIDQFVDKNIQHFITIIIAVVIIVVVIVAIHYYYMIVYVRY